MRDRAQIQLLPDGRRLHLHDGPIDIVLQAFGASREVETAYRAAAERFVTVLDELCGELPFLRTAICPGTRRAEGTVAQRMADAVALYAEDYFITPMAAVAGAVAEEILESMTSAADISRAYVNDGGDIALYLSAGQSFVVGMVERPDRPSLFGTATVGSDQPVRGIATSGWRGRSFSMGIADAVTVLADTASAADAAATIIANTVDLPGNSKIKRVAACELSPDSDLGSRLVTQAVGTLTAEEVSAALDAGASTVASLLERGLIRAAALSLQGEARTIGIDNRVFVTPAAEHRTLIHA